MFGPIYMISCILGFRNIRSFFFFLFFTQTSRTKGKKIYSSEIPPSKNKLEASVMYLVALREMRTLLPSR